MLQSDGARRGQLVRIWTIAKPIVFLACFAADLFVLRTIWTKLQIGDGQFRRGYFERFDGEIGLAMDDQIKPLFEPSFLLTDDGALAAQPGMVAVALLRPGTGYELSGSEDLAPYVVIGTEAPLAPLEPQPPSGEARLAGARTLSVQDGRLALVDWDGGRPWREDQARLSALRDQCAADRPARLRVDTRDDALAIRLGRCELIEPVRVHAGAPMLASLSGPTWARVTRQPAWSTERLILWPVLGVVLIKVAALWWVFGPMTVVVTSTALALASLRVPVPATLTWPLLLGVGIAAALVRGAVIFVRSLPALARPTATALLVLLVAWTVWRFTVDRRTTEPNWGTAAAHDRTAAAHDPCVVVGYSTVDDRGLRRERGGIRWILNERCGHCRDNTASLALGGATMTWARDALCDTPSSFGAGGHVVFLGGANDDLLTAVGSMARLFVVTQQGLESWRRIQETAAAGSLAQIDAQTRALDGFIDCAMKRHARLLFLHDFVASDLQGGRTSDRARMLNARRDEVERAGGTFIDLLETFRAEAGVWWFNDFVHPSRVAHERIAELAAGQLGCSLGRDDASAIAGPS